MRRTVAQLILLALLALGVSQADAITYWVATTGNDANACSAIDGESDPGVYRASVDGACACMSGAGHTIRIKSGTYTQQFNCRWPAGTSTARTTIRVDTGATVTLAPNGPGWSANDVIRIHDRPYNTITGEHGTLTISGANNANGGYVVRFTGTSNNGILRNATIENGGLGSTDIGGGVNVIDSATDTVLSQLIVRNNGNSTASPAQEHGIYIRAARTIIERSRIHNNSGWGIHGWNSSKTNNGNVYRQNEVHNNAAHGILAGAGDNQAVWGNLVYSNGGHGVMTGYNSTGTQFWNNTIYANGNRAVYIRSNSFSIIVRNNIFYQNTGGDSILDESGGSYTASNNTTANPLFEAAASRNFNLQAGSPAIGAGMNTPYQDCGESAGLACNTGAYQPPRIAQCTVDGATLTVSWYNFAHPPLVSTTLNRFTARVNGGSATLNAASLIGETQTQYTLATPVIGTDTVTLQCITLGCANAGAYVGGTLFAMATPASEVTCNNITGASPSTAVLRQIAYAIGKPDPTVNWRFMVTNAPVTIPSPAAVYVTLKVENITANWGVAGFAPYYSTDNGTTKILIPATPGADNIGFYGQARLADQTTLTERLAAASTYVAGLFLKQPGITPQINFAVGTATELAYALYFAPGITPGTVYRIYLKLDNDQNITWIEAPSLTIGPPEAGFVSNPTYATAP